MAIDGCHFYLRSAKQPRVVTMMTPYSDARAPAAKREGTPYLVLGLLCLVNLFNFLDRMLVAALGQPIKDEFHLSDLQLGLLTGAAFVVLYATVALPVARLADRFSRSKIIAIALTLWSLMTVLTGTAHSFGGILCARVGVGIGEAACIPAAYSLISSHFVPDRRAWALSLFSSSSMIGALLSFSVGGLLGASYGWRTAFLALGLPGVLIAGAMAVLIQDKRPPSSSAQSPTIAGAVQLFAANRAIRWLIIAAALAAFPTVGLTSWLAIFFIRSHHMSVVAAGTSFGTAYGVGMILGLLVGGRWADHLSRRSLNEPLRICVWMSLILPLVYLLSLWVASATFAVLLACAGATISGLLVSPQLAALQNACPPEMRARASALQLIATSLLGVALGPFIVGVLSDLLHPRFGAESLRYALAAFLLVSFAAALAFRRARAAMRVDQGQPSHE